MNDVAHAKPRPRRRRRKRYVINAWRLTLSCLLFLLFLELVVTAVMSPWFYITKVKVEGTRILSTAVVSKHLSIPTETNLFRLRTRRIAQHLRSNPIVLSASVHKVVPGTLVIKIVERKAVLILRTHGKYYEVDRTGVPFHVVSKPSPKLPLVVCRIPQKVPLGRSLKAQSFRSARGCLLLAQRKKNFAVAKISVDQNGDLCLNTPDGLEVRLGRPAGLEEKLDIVESTIEQLPTLRTGAEYIDVTCGREGSALKFKERP